MLLTASFAVGASARGESGSELAVVISDSREGLMGSAPEADTLPGNPEELPLEVLCVCCC